MGRAGSRHRPHGVARPKQLRSATVLIGASCAALTCGLLTFGTTPAQAFNGGQNLAGAIDITGLVPGAFVADNTNADASPNDALAGADHMSWWKFTATADQQMTVCTYAKDPVFQNGDTQLAMYDGSTFIGFNDDAGIASTGQPPELSDAAGSTVGSNSSMHFTAVNGHTYKIGFGGYVQSSGLGVVNVVTGSGANACNPAGLGLPSKPAPPTATPATSTVSVSWSPPASWGSAAARGYSVTYSTTRTGSYDPAPGCEGSLTAIATSCTANLTDSSQYFFKVAAINTIGAGDASLPSGTTVPAAPAILPSSAAANQQVVLNWVPGDDGGDPIVGYDVLVSTNGSASFPAAGAGCSPGEMNASTATSCTATGLTNGSTYQYKVAAINGLGTGAYATSAVFTPATVPIAPVRPTGTASNHQVVLNWVAPADSGGSAILDYTVSAATTSGGSPPGTYGLSPAGCIGAQTGLTCTATGLTNGTNYYFVVTARNAIGSSPASPESAALTPATVTAAPDAPSVEARDSAVNVTWVAPTDIGGSAIVGHRVQISEAPGGPYTDAAGACLPATTLVSTAVTCRAGALTNGHTYYFTVATKNGIGESAPSAHSAGVTPTASAPAAPAAPTGVATNAQVVLSWVAPTDTGTSAITGYAVQVATASSSGPWSSAGTGCAPASTNSATSVTCTATGLTNDQAYYFRVAAINSIGTGDFSPASSALTPPAPPPAAPVFFTQSPSGCGGFPAKIKSNRTTVVLPRTCTTNAGQTLSVSTRTASAKLAKRVKIVRAAKGKVSIKIVGKPKVAFTLIFSAGESGQFRAYQGTHAYIAK